MYAFIQKSGHVVWKKRWYALTLGISLQVDLYMTWNDQVFVVDVVVSDLMHEMVALNVISWLVCVVVKFNAIAKICKYRRLHEGHYFIPMAMEAHDTTERDMDCFIKDCARLFHDRQ
jgi:hypothetical protein